MTTETATDPGNQNPGEGAPNNDSAANPPQAPAATAQPGTEGNGAAAPKTGEEGEAGEQQGAPEQYEAFKVAEGFKLEGERLSKAQEFAKAHGWTQAQAQEAVDWYVQMAGEDAKSMAASAAAFRQDIIDGKDEAVNAVLEERRLRQIEQWGRDTKANLGDKFEETTGLARTAVQAVNDPELIKVFNDLGWGNHPQLVKMSAFYGQFLRDSKVDGLGGGTSDGPGASDPKSVLYGGT